jgi:signal transduction histidine kinase
MAMTGMYAFFRLFRTITAGFCLSAVFFIPAFAQTDTTVVFSEEEKVYLEKKGVIRMSVDPNWMPFESIDKSGRHIGMSADFIRIMARRGKLNIQLIPAVSWDEAMHMVESRKSDMLALAAYTPGRARFLDFTTPFIEVQAVVATLIHQPFINSMEELADKRVGVIRGYSHAELIRRKHPAVRVVELEHYEEGLEKLQRGELYGIAGNMASIGYAIQKAKMANVKIGGRMDGDVMLSVATRNDEPLLGAIFEKLVRSLTDEDKRTVSNRWLNVRYEHATDRRLLYQIFIGMLLMGVVFTIWLYKLRQLNGRLKRVNAELETINTQKNFLFSVIGHDLRNPFMSISGLSTELRDNAEAFTPAELRRSTGIIQEKADHALAMLNQLLEWAKVEMHQFVRSNEAVDVNRLVEDAMVLYGLSASTKGVKLKNELPVALILKADRNMLAIILRNLISNAIKYSRFGDAVTVWWEEDSRRLVVADTGIGMSQETLARLFGALPNKSTPGTGNEQGTGLGIAICQRYAKEMNMELSATSTPGKGSVFYLKV